MSNQEKSRSSRIVVQVIFFIVVMPLLPVLIGRRRRWWEAWTYAAISIFSFLISRALVARRHPDLLAERARFADHGDAKRWDKLLAPLVGLGGGLIPLIAGLEARSDQLRRFRLSAKVTALGAILAGNVLGTWALLVNRFFSGTVRIQRDRDHHVVSQGPYAVLRHPGYASALLVYLAAPILLDSVRAFVPATLLSLALVIRTYLEDRTLQEELPGYREYANEVRYRLLPGIW